MSRTVAAALVAMAVAIAGCGDEEEVSLSGETLAQAAQRTDAVGGTRFEMTMTMTGPDGEDFQMSGYGVMDTDTQRGRMILRIPGVDGQMEQILDGLVVWTRSEQFAGKLPGGAEWIRIDMRRATKALGFDIGPFAQAGNDPTKTLDYLRTAADVEKKGEDELRGVTTSHYEAIVDLRDVPRVLPKRERAGARKSVETLIDLTGEPRIPMEVWIDGEDLVRRMRMRMPMRIPGDERVAMEIDHELYDFGTDVDVKPPPPEDVVDYTEFLARANREGLEQLR